jgi:hypothetical protein
MNADKIPRKVLKIKLKENCPQERQRSRWEQ